MNALELQYSKAPKGRNIKAQGAALCNECNADFVAPRINIIQGDKFAWGKINNRKPQRGYNLTV